MNDTVVRQHKLQYRSYKIYFLPYFVIKMENVFVVYIYILIVQS